MLASSSSPSSSPHIQASRRTPYHQRLGRASPLLRSPNLPKSPLSAAQPEPPLRKDAGTQYTPEGLPPTARQPGTQVEPLAGAGAAPSASELANPPQQVASVAPPSEPALRVEPEPLIPTQHGTPAATAVPQATPPTVATASAMVTTTTPPSTATAVAAVAVVSESPTKRARQSSAADKTMPVHYQDADVRDLGKIIASMLGELVRINDKIPLQDGKLTRWHSRAPPGISVRDYLIRLIVHATLSPPILLSMVYYLDLLCNRYPVFTLTSLTVHRFLISAATVAAKGLSDSFWTNNTYARVGGVSVRELALLELELLQKLDWRIVPRPEVLEDYYRSLVERTEGYVLEKPAQSSTQDS